MAFGRSHPKAPLGGGYIIDYTSTTPIGLVAGAAPWRGYIGVGLVNDGLPRHIPTRCSLLSQIDQKMDDGLPAAATGKFMAPSTTLVATVDPAPFSLITPAMAAIPVGPVSYCNCLNATNSGYATTGVGVAYYNAKGF